MSSSGRIWVHKRVRHFDVIWRSFEGHLKVMWRSFEGHLKVMNRLDVFLWINTHPVKLSANSCDRVSVSYWASMLASESKSESSESDSEELELGRFSSSWIGGKFFLSSSAIFRTLSPPSETTQRHLLLSDWECDFKAISKWPWYP